MSQPTVKYFCIGLNKTGTTTLHECAKLLGLRSEHFNNQLLKDIVKKHDFTSVASVVAMYDVFSDWPWPLIYKELDTQFPGSKFILTVRKNEDCWLKSLKKHSMLTRPFATVRKMAYGYNYPHGHEEKYLEFYRSHNSSVREFFKDRPDDLIELCWEQGDGWEKLCAFLGKQIPELPFPHANNNENNQPSFFRTILNRLLSHIS